MVRVSRLRIRVRVIRVSKSQLGRLGLGLGLELGPLLYRPLTLAAPRYSGHELDGLGPEIEPQGITKAVFTGWMPFLLLNQHCRSTKGYND